MRPVWLADKKRIVQPVVGTVLGSLELRCCLEIEGGLPLCILAVVDDAAIAYVDVGSIVGLNTIDSLQFCATAVHVGQLIICSAIENGAVLQNTAAVSNGSAMKMVGNGVIKTDATFTQEGAITGDSLVKSGTGSLTMTGNLTTARTIVQEGSMNYSGNNYNKVVELRGNASISGNGFIPSPINVASGARATLTLTNTYYMSHSGALTGSGQLTINPTNTVNRVAITGNWTNFTGTIVYNNTSILMPLKNSGMPNATLSTGANTNIGIAASSSNAIQQQCLYNLSYR